jgi:hypothetical protein
MVKPVMPLIEYYANYDYIATVLCENKDKPYLECNGKCYLQDRIEQNSDSKTHDHNSNLPLISLDDYPVSPIDYFSYHLFSEENLNISAFKNAQNTSQEFLNILFRPPKA